MSGKYGIKNKIKKLIPLWIAILAGVFGVSAHAAHQYSGASWTLEVDTQIAAPAVNQNKAVVDADNNVSFMLSSAGGAADADKSLYLMLLNGGYDSANVTLLKFSEVSNTSPGNITVSGFLPSNYDEAVDRLYLFAGSVSDDVYTASSPVNLSMQRSSSRVTVSVNDSGAGTASGALENISYGSAHTVKATANSGYRFVNWTENGTEVSTSATYKIASVKRNYDLTANFELIPSISDVTISPATAEMGKGESRQFSAAVTGQGSFDQSVSWSIVSTCPDTKVSSSGVLTIGSKETAATLTLKATSKADTTKSAESVITVKADASYTVKVASANTSYGSASGGKSAVAGSNVTINAAPNAGYEFVNWTYRDNGSIYSNEKRCVISSINQDYDLIANFKAVPTVTGLTITPDSIEVQKGKSLRFQAVITGTGSFDEAVTWSVVSTCVETTISTAGVLTIGEKETAKTLEVKATSVANKNISAKARVTVKETEVIYYTISVESSNEKWGSVSGGGQVSEDGNVTIKAKANEGGRFLKWTLDGETVSTSTHYKISKVKKAATYIAEFESETAQPQPPDITVIDAGGIDSLVIKCEILDANANQLNTFHKAKGEYLLAQTYDITAWSGKTQLFELDHPVTFEMEIPSDYLRTDRKFKLLQIHSGKASELKDEDIKEHTITVTASHFSPYALIYFNDLIAEEEEEAQQKRDNVPYTGDNSLNIIGWLLMVSIVALAGVYYLSHAGKVDTDGKR